MGRPELQRRRREPRLSPHGPPESRPRPPAQAPHLHVDTWEPHRPRVKDSTYSSGRQGQHQAGFHPLGLGAPGPLGGPRLAWKTMCSVGAPGPPEAPGSPGRPCAQWGRPAPRGPRLTWKTMCSVKVCFVQRMTYSVSDSVRATGSGEDLKRGPSPWNSGTAASCSETHRTRVHPAAQRGL